LRPAPNAEILVAVNEAPALPAAPAGPRPFSRWLTVLGTLVIAAALLGGLAVKRKSVVDTRAGEPLAAFDTLIRREPLDEPLADPVAADAERALGALLAESSAAAATRDGARARLAVVLGERGRWREVEPLLATGEAGTVFPRVVTCAYGPDRKACDGLAACDQARLAALTASAGAWCAARACVVAAGRIGDTAAAKRLAELPARFPRLRAARAGLEGSLLAAGLLAAAILFRRRRQPRPPRPDLPTPWSLGALYAALVRCLLWSMLVAFALLAVLEAGRRGLGTASVGAVLYAVGLWWIARIVFRRWGISWRDSLGWPARREIGLTMLAAIGVRRLGEYGIGLAASALHHRSAWTDLPPALDPAARWRLAMSVLEMVVLPPLVEELVFRRALLARLLRDRSPTFAIVASSVCFTLPHGYSPLGLVTIFWSGLVFGWAFHRTGNLWPSVAAHAYGNGMALWWSLM
jgi:membrane protease YdiL (CAAX protease family)